MTPRRRVHGHAREPGERLAEPGARAGPTAAAAAPAAAPLGASSPVRADEARVSWRPSRHARRLLTLAVAALLHGAAHQEPGPGRRGRPAAAAARHGPGSRPASSGRPDRLAVRVGLTSTRMYEGEPAAVDVSVADEQHDARWTFEPGRGIEPGSAVAVNGPAARFTFEVPRWGKRGVGAVTLALL